MLFLVMLVQLVNIPCMEGGLLLVVSVQLANTVLRTLLLAMCVRRENTPKKVLQCVRNATLGIIVVVTLQVSVVSAVLASSVWMVLLHVYSVPQGLHSPWQDKDHAPAVPMVNTLPQVSLTAKIVPPADIWITWVLQGVCYVRKANTEWMERHNVLGAVVVNTSHCQV
jgi:hypothetical protein